MSITISNNLYVVPKTNQKGVLLWIIIRVSYMKVEIPRWQGGDSMEGDRLWIMITSLTQLNQIHVTLGAMVG
jgi:hypothetical protein